MLHKIKKIKKIIHRKNHINKLSNVINLLYIELWCIIFKDLWPIDIINIKLTCKLFNNICTHSDYFKNCWKYFEYNEILCGRSNGDIYNLYCGELVKTFDPRTCMDDNVIINSRILITASRYGDINLVKKELNKLDFDQDKTKIGSQLNLNGRSCAIECSIRSGNIELIKYLLINSNLPSGWIFWDYVLIEAVDIGNVNIVNLIKNYMNDSNKTIYGFILCAIKNDLVIGNILLDDFIISDRAIPIESIDILDIFIKSLYKNN